MIQRWRTLSPYWRRTIVRLALLPFILFLLYTTIFVSLEVVYDPVGDTRYIGPGNTEELIEALRDELGLNDQAWEKYQRFLRDTFTLDFGASVVNQRPVHDIIQQAWPTSVQLLSMATVIGIAVALATAQSAATRVGRYVTPPVAALLAAAPVFYLSLLAVALPAQWWDYAPPVGERIDFFSNPAGNLKQYALPSLVLGVSAGLWSSRVTRAHLSAATASGRNRLLCPAAIAFVDMLPFLLTGIILVEVSFNLPGLGLVMFQAAILKDIYPLEALLILVALVAVLSWTFAPSFAWPDRESTASAQRPARSWHKNPLLVAGLVVAAAYVLLGLIGPWVAPDDALAFGNPHERAQTPSWDHWFGTDFVARDTLSLILAGSRRALEFTILVIGAGFVPGIIVGRLANAATRRVSGVAAGLVELAGLLRALPVLPLLFLLVATYGADRSSAVWAMSILAFALALQLALLPTITPTAIVGGLGLTAAASISAHAITGAFLLNNDDGATWGRLVVRPFQHDPIHHTAAAFPAAAITIFTAGFLLIRTSLDDLDPPRPYER